jgi:hypothetical protein
LHLLDATMAHLTLAPCLHWSTSLDSQALSAEAQAWGSRNTSTYGPADGSSGGPSRMGLRSKGIGQSNVVTVEAAEYSSRFCDDAVSI